jgi:hypothetical protein
MKLTCLAGHSCAPADTVDAARMAAAVNFRIVARIHFLRRGAPGALSGGVLSEPAPQCQPRHAANNPGG